ncbi:MAG: hypothetical protein KAW14_08070 [Candidatus Aegiribacteria sp.]|nr:hypothetical protein [Candidatus Aegiribacteria sp.]
MTSIRHELDEIIAVGITDTSAMQLTSLTIDHQDPLERKRLRDAIRRYGGDSTLVDLPDDEFDGALHLVSIVDGKRYPTLAGLLMIGHEDILRQQVPAHEVAFQVLEGTDVRMNLFFRMPFIKVLEEIERLFTAQVREKEFQVGFDRIQQEQMVLSYIDKHGSIKRADVMELCRISGPQAYHLLKRLKEQKKIHQKGKKRYAVYTREA